MGRIEDIKKIIDASLNQLSSKPEGLCLTYNCYVTPMHKLEQGGYPIMYKIKLGKRETKYNYILAVPKHAIATPNFSIIVEDTDYPGGLRWEHNWTVYGYMPARDEDKITTEYKIDIMSWYIEEAIRDLVIITLTNKEPNK